MNGFRLAVDYGSSNTVALLGWPDGRVRPLLFGGSPLLPSAVHADHGGRLVVGADAHRAARLDPARFEANPKRRIDQETLLLGDAEVRVVDLVAATLRVVAAEAMRTAGVVPGRVALTYPAAWAGPRQAKLIAAARAAGLGEVTLVPEPVAAATYFATQVGARGDVVVYDLGGGTCDVSVVRASPNALQVLVSDGLDDLGGLDLDQVVLELIGAAVAPAAPAEWARLTAPGTPADRRAAMMLRDDVRTAKEALSRHPSATVLVPNVDRDIPVTREAFEHAATLRLSPSADLTLSVLARAGLDPSRIAGLFLVGGATRVPAVATLLHRRTGITPTVLEQPEIVVAEGALALIGPVHHAPPAPSTSPAPVAGAPQSVAPQRVPVRRRRVWAAAAALTLVAVVAAGAVLRTVLEDDAGPGAGRPGASASASTSSAPVAASTSKGPVAALPDPCSFAGDLATRYRFFEPQVVNERGRWSCDWNFQNTNGAGGLAIKLELADGSAIRSSFEARKQLNHGLGEDEPESVPGLGDDAYLIRQRMTGDQQGTRLTVRDRNVLIDIRWFGYAPPGADASRFSFTQLREDVVAIAERILPRLT